MFSRETRNLTSPKRNFFKTRTQSRNPNLYFKKKHYVMQDGLPNELRIDAAEGSYAKGSGQGIAASVRVELSRIWKMKPERSGKNIT